MSFQFDLHFRYENEKQVRPYVVNCNLSKVGFYSKQVARLAEVEEIFIRIHPKSPVCKFHEFTI